MVQRVEEKHRNMLDERRLFAVSVSDLIGLVSHGIASRQVVFLFGIVQRVEETLGQWLQESRLIAVSLSQLSELLEQGIASRQVVFLFGMVQRVEQQHRNKPGDRTVSARGGSG